jgi:WD40 repeat protein/DNA-binding SARP family transcriptional activator
MLQVRLLGQFDVRADGKKIAIPTRAGQSLFAYLILNAGTPHRRERLAGMFWPDTSDENARRNLRQELWRTRKAISAQSPAEVEYLAAEEISITFDSNADYWLDVAQFERTDANEDSASELMQQLSLYRGGLLPGFYDDWVVLERERLQALYEQRLQQLLEHLIAAQLWTAVLEWSEKWIALGQTPEPAFRALMLAYGARGDTAKLVSTYERCREALDKEVGVDPSDQTRELYEKLVRGERVPAVDLRPRAVAPPHPISQSAEDPPAPGEPPFKGLQFFDVNDADLFFGREMLTAKLVGRLRENSLLAVVVGASGSGKSSLVRAGLIPIVKKGELAADGTRPPKGSATWDIHVITPTAHPLEALAIALTRQAESLTATTTLMDDLSRDPRSFHLYLKRRALHVMLVIDQFEELFTLCRDEFEREAFIDNLLATLTPSLSLQASVPERSEGRRGSEEPVLSYHPEPVEGLPKDEGLVTLILTIRADFYTHLAQYPELREWVAQQQEYIGPMNSEELRRAIEEPARRGGWEFEPGLVDLILRDLGDEPGALPLLSHALLETWMRRRGRRMTLIGYAESGGVRGAIAQTAGTTYHRLTPEQQASARNIFLRLTELGEGTEDTRRRASIGELIPQRQAEADVRAVLTILADARLVTLGEDTAEVAHEALIREWPMLREWLAQDREGLRLHRRLTQAAHEWELLERDPGSLYRGARLAQANEFAQVNANSLNELERAFLAASNELEQKELREREAQRQRELEAAQKLAEEQQRRAEEQGRAAKQLRQRAVFLAGAFVLAIVLAGIALFFGEQARLSAVAAQSNASAAQKQERIASARELAARANSNLQVDPERSMLLAVQAINVTSIDRTVLPEAEEALHRAIQASHIQFTLSGHKSPVVALAYSPDRTRLATISKDGTAKEWDTATGKELLTIPGHAASQDWSGAWLGFSPDGSWLATNENNTIYIWDAASGKELQTLASDSSGLWAAVYSPDGAHIAAASGGNSVKIWDADTGRQLFTMSGHKDVVLTIAFSPDGKRIASGGLDQTVRLWDAATGRPLMTFTGYINYINNVAFSPDGKLLATTSQDATIHIWDTFTGALVNVFATVEPSVVTFNADGSRLAAANINGTVTILDVATGKTLLTLAGHTNAVNSVAYSPDGKHLASGSDDRTVKIWDITPDRELFTLTNNGVAINRVDYSPDGTRMVTGSDDGVVKIWDAATGKELLTLPGQASGVYGVSFSPDGTRLAVAYRNQVAKVWNATTGKLLLTLRGHTAELRGVAFSPDGKYIATGSFDKTVRLWDATTGTELLTLSDPNSGVTRIAYSPDGARIAAAYVDGRALVWDVQTAKPLLTLTGHTGIVWGIAYDPGGKRIATASADKTVKVWDAASGRELYTFRGHSGQVWPVAFSRDGTRIAAGSVDQMAIVLNADTGIALQTLPGHTSGVYGVAFNADGTRLLTASDDGTARVYLLRIEDLVALAKSRLTRTWTVEECQQFLHLAECPSAP